MALEDRHRICVGKIMGAHGIHGEVKIKTFTEQPGDMTSYGLLEDEAAFRRFELTHARPVKAGLVARFAGISERSSAEALTGVKLYVDRDQLPETEEDVWYYTDLIDLQAVTPAGENFGKVVAVQNYGAGDLLEIKPEGAQDTMLMRFTSEEVPKIDLKAGCVVVCLPPEQSEDDTE